MLLRPDVIQLSANLVHGIDTDEVRQSLARARQQIADSCGGIAFARGVTTDAERIELLRLGVRLGQGPLFGSAIAGGE